MSNKFQITFVLDRSGSMDSVRDATISGFNEFLQQQKNAPGDAKVTLVQFDDQIETVYRNVDIKEVSPLTRTSFVPRGMTALYDAVARGIQEAQNSVIGTWAFDVKNIVVILTDGHENVSKEFNLASINNLVTSKRNAGWDFVYLGANQDAWAVGQSLGVAAGYTKTYSSDNAGTTKVFRGLSSSMTSYRGAVAGGQSVSNFFDPADDVTSE